MTYDVLPRQRGSKEFWLNEAYELLISDGIEAVKIMPIAKRLNLTRTGFYWYFNDIAELHSAMIHRWETKNTGNLIERCNADATNICEALFNLMDCWFDTTLFDARLDLAIRNWARNDANLQKRLTDADKKRIDAVTNVFRRFGYSNRQADVRGMTVIYTQIGYISMQVTEDRHERLFRVQNYVELFAGVHPNDHDIENFTQRHRHRLELPQ